MENILAEIPGPLKSMGVFTPFFVSYIRYFSSLILFTYTHFMTVIDTCHYIGVH